MAMNLSVLSASPNYFLVMISVSGSVNPRDTVQPEVLGKLINSVTSSGLEPVAFRLVAQCFDQLHLFQKCPRT
jgi:hypothetical protein